MEGFTTKGLIKYSLMYMLNIWQNAGSNLGLLCLPQWSIKSWTWVEFHLYKCLLAYDFIHKLWFTWKVLSMMGEGMQAHCINCSAVISRTTLHQETLVLFHQIVLTELLRTRVASQLMNIIWKQLRADNHLPTGSLLKWAHNHVGNLYSVPKNWRD